MEKKTKIDITLPAGQVSETYDDYQLEEEYKWKNLTKEQQTFIENHIASAIEAIVGQLRFQPIIEAVILKLEQRNWLNN